MLTPRPRPSPNFGPRRGGQTPRLVVLHYTAMADCGAALDRLCDPSAEVSAHYLIAADGTLWSLVDETARAWHAGAGAWGQCADVNSASIGIELDNDGCAPFPDPQMAALEGLLDAVLTRWQIPPQGVIGHQDMAPTRKRDPGALFDWPRLAAKGLSVWPDPKHRPGDFGRDLTAFGYPAAPPAARLAAFRARFRPGATGPLDDTDRRLAADLARRFPVDAGEAGT